MPKFRNKTIYQALGREPVHPFPARMAPGIALQVMSDMEKSRVLDPMMGSGTVLAVARAEGHRGIGFDLDPLAVLISKVWTTVLNTEDVIDRAIAVLESASAELKNIALRDAYPDGSDEETRQFIRYWFDGHARRQLAALSLAIRSCQEETTRNALWCAFSRLIISKQSGASRAMDLSHSRPHRMFDRAPAKPFDKFLSAVERVVANGIDDRSPDRGPAPTVKLGDARKMALPNQSIDLVLTSPPYLNAIDYIRCSKFSLVWMGYKIGEMRQVRTESVGTEAAGQSPLDDDKEITSIVDELKLRRKLEKRQERILRRYIHDMRGSICEVGRVHSHVGHCVEARRIGRTINKGTENAHPARQPPLHAPTRFCPGDVKCKDAARGHTDFLQMISRDWTLL
jgi:hypothetical protein